MTYYLMKITGNHVDFCIVAGPPPPPMKLKENVYFVSGVNGFLDRGFTMKKETDLYHYIESNIK